MRRFDLILLVLALLFLAGIGAGYGFWYASVGTLSARSADLANQIDTKRQDSARVAVAKATLANLSADEMTVRQYLVPTSDVVPFLESLGRTGTGLGSGVEVVSVAADPSTGKGRGHITLSLKITGSFDGVLRTLGAIEYGPYDSQLMSLTFDTVPSPDGSSTNGPWTAAATFSIGTESSPAPATATTTPPANHSV